MYEAFRLNVKRSLLVLSKAINGDSKSGPYPLFNIKVLLENNKVGQLVGCLTGLARRHYFTEVIIKILNLCLSVSFIYLLKGSWMGRKREEGGGGGGGGC